jgi:type I restriction enzyme S subunit
MIAGLKPYADNKESGLPWLGQVPAHWDTRRLRHACDLRVSNVDKHTKVGEAPVRLCNYVEVYKNARIRESTRFMAATATEDERERFGLCKSDVLITKDSEQWNDIGVPALVEFEAPDLVCGYHLAILRARPGLNGAFLHRALESHFIAAQFHVEANGVTRYGLSRGAILSVAIPLPPPDEQVAIVRFLDWANGRLERAIRAKRKVIALLNEQKQAIIHRAVTRGLDPSVPLKPSGIQWLGDIPRHWEVRRAKQLCAAIVDCKNRTPEMVDGGGYVVVRTTNIRNGMFNPKGSYSTDRRSFDIWTQRGAPRVGDIFFTREAPVGEACHVPDQDNLCMGQRMMYFRPRASVLDADFLLYSIYGPVVRRYIEIEANGSTVGHLRLGQVSALPLLWCSLKEQQAIVTHIAAESEPLMIIASRLEREIELLREYRIRLVADVVTGKLDVRDAALRLPIETPFDTTEDDADLGDETEAEGEEAPA